MKTVKGIYAEAKIFTEDVEEYAQAQVKMICDSQMAEGSRIRPGAGENDMRQPDGGGEQNTPDAGYSSRQGGSHRLIHDNYRKSNPSAAGSGHRLRHDLCEIE